MCGRFTLTADHEALMAEFDLIEPFQVTPRFNIAPSQTALVVRAAEGGGTGATPHRRIDNLRWGLIPHWAKDEKIAYRTINARAETVATLPAFRDAFKRRRCIIPASGFYEWQKQTVGKKEVKTPYRIGRTDQGILALAGLWSRWTSPEGVELQTFTIITTTPNNTLQVLHDRMPVILARKNYDKWMEKATPAAELQPLLVACPDDWLAFEPADPNVLKIARKPSA